MKSPCCILLAWQEGMWACLRIQGPLRQHWMAVLGEGTHTWCPPSGCTMSCSQDSAGAVSWRQKLFKKEQGNELSCRVNHGFSAQVSFSAFYIQQYGHAPWGWGCGVPRRHAPSLGMPTVACLQGLCCWESGASRDVRSTQPKWDDPWQLCMSLLSVCGKCKEGLAKPQWQGVKLGQISSHVP